MTQNINFDTQTAQHTDNHSINGLLIPIFINQDQKKKKPDHSRDKNFDGPMQPIKPQDGKPSRYTGQPDMKVVKIIF